MLAQGRSFSGHERNCCFLNTGRQRFATISAVSGLDYPDDGRAVAVTDWDQDGDLDLWISNRNAPRLRLFRNDSPANNHYLTVRLTGDGKTSHRDAIGARLEVEVEPPGPHRMVKTLRAGEGFLSQSSKWVHFGLGDSSEIRKVVIRWPGGASQVYSGLEVDRRYELVQGSADPRLLPPVNRTLAVAPSIPRLPASTPEARIPLLTRLPIGRHIYDTFEDSEGILDFNVAAANGQSILLVLWASWCPSCLAELHELAQRADELRAAEIQVVALSVEGLEGEKSDPGKAASVVRKLQLPFSTGLARRELLEELQQHQNEQIFLRHQWPLPCSFLFDQRGRLSLLYRGKADVEVILADSVQLRDDHDYVDKFTFAASLPGRAIDSPWTARAACSAELGNRYRLASALEDANRWDDAVAMLQGLLEVNPQSTHAHLRLANVFLRQRQLKRALDQCQTALEQQPDIPSLHNVKGMIYGQSQRPDLAMKSYRKAIELLPNYPEAHNNLGNVLAAKGDLGSAAKHFQRAIEIDADMAEAHNNLGRLYAMRGNRDRAIRHLRKALRIDPDFAEAFNNLGTIYAKGGDFSRAAKCYQRALEKNSEYDEARKNLQRAMARLKDGKK